MSKLIIWDLDGTLVHSLPASLEAFKDGVEPCLGRRLTNPEIMTHFGQAEDKIIAKLVGETHAAASYSKYLQSMTRRLRETLLFDGIIDALQKLTAAQYTLGIFTGRGRDGAELILEHFGLHSYFLEIVTTSECENHKPHPEGIHKICKKAGIAESKTIMVGDSPMDMLAAHHAGAIGIGCTWDAWASREGLLQAKATHIIQHPRELYALTER